MHFSCYLKLETCNWILSSEKTVCETCGCNITAGNKRLARQKNQRG